MPEKILGQRMVVLQLFCKEYSSPQVTTSHLAAKVTRDHPNNTNNLVPKF